MSDLQREREIPVLTVWKNNSILKNIFLVNTPPNFSNFNQQNDNNPQEFEETLVVGRHPDCDIRLEHPSISRFHLKIHSFPSNNNLFLTDLSSVHGTWVSGKRIEPNNRTVVKEGDELRIGVSSRVYKLHWIPLGQAYDVSKPFVPPLDFEDVQEDEDEIIKGLESLDLCDEDKMAEQRVVPQGLSLQLEKSISVKDEVNDIADSDFEGLDCLDDLSLELGQKELIPGDVEDFKNEDVQSVDSIFEGLVPLFMEEDHLQSVKDEVTEFTSLVLEGLDTLFLDENSELLAQTVMPSAPLMPKDMELPTQQNLDDISTDEEQDFVSEILENKNEIPLQEENVQDSAWNFWYGSLVAPSGCFQLGMENENPQHETESLDLSDNEFLINTSSNLNTSYKNQENEPWSFWSGKMGVESVCSALSDVEPLSESENKSFTNGFLSSPLSSHKRQTICSSLSDGESFSESENESCRNCYQSPMAHSSVEESFESPLMTSDQNPLDSIWSRRGKLASGPQVLTSRTEKEKTKTDQKNANHESISRTLFHGTSNQEKEGDGEEVFTPDKENFTPSTHKSMRKFAVLKDITNSSSGKSPPLKMSLSPNNHYDDIVSPLTDREEAFTPDKENLTPFRHKSTRKFDMLKEKLKSSSGKSPLSKTTFCPENHFHDSVSPLTDIENYSVRNQQKQKTPRPVSSNQVQSARLKERNGERVPFQSLLDSPQKIIPECCTLDKKNGSYVGCENVISVKVSNFDAYLPESCTLDKKNGSYVGCENVISVKVSNFDAYLPECCTLDKKNGSYVGCENVISVKETCIREGIKQWNMVVDTATLLNKESRKALQLLEGLKGTQLIIPRIVITELASLKRQVSFFKRNTEVISALEWIEDCMVKTQWWVHVQNSVDDGRPVAPTPPASPHSPLSCGSYTFSGLDSRRELLSPTIEDDVLDYALSFRKNNNDGQLVLLSNDITMKIKAMAEGMICETPEEFRESLVNPFSERFRWTDSCPRGRTWSCADDIVLKEKFYPRSLKMTPRGMANVKGLKLILLHNSGYYESMTAAY